jgi:predicted DNA-binding antitoxin AbrB/MazE fold protein
VANINNGKKVKLKEGNTVKTVVANVSTQLLVSVQGEPDGKTNRKSRK